ncbi:NUMA1 protein, partial [Bombycilla garrulus]|nr:NUMA1 protein [Bombycilla garrulus]
TAFNILNTPRGLGKLGRRLLRRAGAQKGSSPTPSTSSGTRRSPRIASAKSPKGRVG